ncbi:chromosome condensation protein CrcB [Saccharomonospora sp. CUA-673]|uniref:fluoride efflux transporter FluC n=1 Tax=Saccharomonospora sp. CUA-673 TaxID=1904969 RepID=UPI00095C976B|nr:CrcB family protein [Saccharomonospora sp. CUA-673]OLT43084.1 chromosome condensation protein CrcB [Saccharomonospora sp. CUA-673]
MTRTRHWDVLLAVAAGGALGSLARYGLGLALPSPAGVATVLANVAGCLALGALMAILSLRARSPRLLRPFLGVGVLGGFTTFSTYVLDTLSAADGGRLVASFAYAAGSVFASLLAVVVGICLARLAARGKGTAP